MSRINGTKTTISSNSTDRPTRLQERRARSRRRSNATQYDWRNEVREVAPLLSARRVLVGA